MQEWMSSEVKFGRSDHIHKQPMGYIPFLKRTQRLKDRPRPQKKRLVFQPSIFRGDLVVSFRDGRSVDGSGLQVLKGIHSWAVCETNEVNV